MDLFSIPIEQKSSATDSARLRLNKRQNHLYSNSSINGRSSGLDNLITGIRCKRICSGNGKLIGNPPRLFSIPGTHFGLFRNGIRNLAIVYRFTSGDQYKREDKK